MLRGTHQATESSNQWDESAARVTSDIWFQTCEGEQWIQFNFLPRKTPDSGSGICISGLIPSSFLFVPVKSLLNYPLLLLKSKTCYFIIVIKASEHQFLDETRHFKTFLQNSVYFSVWVNFWEKVFSSSREIYIFNLGENYLYADGDFEPPCEEEDDEETIEVEEQQAGNDAESHQREIELLKEEGMLPLDQLLNTLKLPPPEVPPQTASFQIQLQKKPQY